MFTIKNSSTIYVSQSTGSNKYYNGLAPTPDRYGNGPLKTIQHALHIVRDLRTCGEYRPLSIVFTDDYLLEETIEIDEKISDITFDSFGTKKKIIGGTTINGWKIDSFNGVKCFSAKLPEKEDETTWNFTDLFVNGKRASITRFPKEGTLKIAASDIGETTDLKHIGLYQLPSKCFDLYTDDLYKIDNIEDAIFNYYHYWIDEHTPIESYDKRSGRLVTKYLSRFSATALHEENHPSSVNYYLTNVPNTFEKVNEWYLDRSSGIVYYIPDDINSDPNSIVAYVPTLNHLINVHSNDIRIRNLELTCTLGDYASTVPHIEGTDPTIEYGSDIQSVCWAPGAIRFENSSRCSISECYIHGVGIHGIEIKTGCSNIRIEDNIIKDICAGGIKIFGGAADEPEEKIARNCIIRNNEIAECGKRYEAGCGILINHASNNEIIENIIHDTGYSGISVGWVWGYAPSSSYGNIIKRNHIYNIGRGFLSDLGGIYLLGKQHGTFVSENRIHDVTSKHYGGWGIYLDEGSSYITVENNIVYKTKNECFHLHYGSQNTVRNNIFFAQNSPCIITSKNELHDELVFEKNIFITDSYPLYNRVTGVHTVNFSRNVIWDISGNDIIPFINREEKEKFTIEEWQTIFHQDMESIFADPKIENLFEYDFTLSDDSPAFFLGFNPLSPKIAKKK